MYSSIEEEDRQEVIQKCYYPLFRLTDTGIPIAIEASGLTLEIIESLAPDWIKKLSQYIQLGKIEFIGSGYSQIIGPLVPSEVNDWNQKLGMIAYEKLLGKKPDIALINEMAYSAGIVEHYQNNGYNAIIMEWNNPRKYHLEWDDSWRYYPQIAHGNNEHKLPLIWADSIAFQQFQRYAHSEINYNQYLVYLESHQEGYFPLYSNDVEVFDFRPGRFNSESIMSAGSEWENITKLMENLADNYSFVFPSTVLDGLQAEKGGHELRLETPNQPIPVKKQKKYNIYRWALTGRNDLKINTKCHRIVHQMASDSNNLVDDWKELCYVWSSDFRTHITEKRWDRYYSRLLDFEKRMCKNIANETFRSSETGNQNFEISENENELAIRNNFLAIIFNKKRGLAISQLRFDNFGLDPLIGTLVHGYFDDISLGADYYSGHWVIEKLGQHKLTSLLACQPEVKQNNKFLEIRSKFDIEDVACEDVIQIDKEIINIRREIILKEGRFACKINPFHFTIIPENFHINSLYFKTCNGGNEDEVFYINQEKIVQTAPYSLLISAQHGLGATGGYVEIGDKFKGIRFYHDLTQSAMIPSVLYQKSDCGRHLFRLIYSAQEVDETFIPDSTEGPYRLKAVIRLQPVDNNKINA